MVNLFLNFIKLLLWSLLTICSIIYFIWSCGYSNLQKHEQVINAHIKQFKQLSIENILFHTHVLKLAFFRYTLTSGSVGGGGGGEGHRARVLPHGFKFWGPKIEHFGPSLHSHDSAPLRRQLSASEAAPPPWPNPGSAPDSEVFRGIMSGLSPRCLIIFPIYLLDIVISIQFTLWPFF